MATGPDAAAQKRVAGKEDEYSLPAREETLPYLFFADFLAAFLAFFAGFLATFLLVFFALFFTATVAPLVSLG
jgi:hypothetical protein